MSKTYTPTPSVKTRARGTNNSQPQPSSQNQSGPGRGRSQINRGRGAVLGARGRGRGQNSSKPTNTRMQSNRMDNSQFSVDGHNLSPERSNRQESEEPCGSEQGQHAGGYTVFQPNARKRQQISEMARRETEQYERYKKDTSGKHYSYVGTAGGGEMTEEMARRRQANEVRAQKFNRLQNQQRWREEKKELEQRDIDMKRAEARRKAEENAARDRAARPEDVRRKREEFLRRLENGQ